MAPLGAVSHRFNFNLTFPTDEELHSLLRSPNVVNKSTRLRWVGHIARMEESRSAFKIRTGKPTGNIPLGRLRHRMEDNIRMKEIGINTSNWVIRLRTMIIGESL